MPDLGYRIIKTDDIYLKEVSVVDKFWVFDEALDCFNQIVKETRKEIEQGGIKNYVAYETGEYVASIRNFENGVIEKIVALQEFELS